jgi:Family of unknown function (DUF5871)
MSSVVSPSAFKVSNVSFSAIKVLDSGGKQAYLNYNSKPLVMQIGSLETPFGMSVFDKIPGAPVKYSVELNLRGYNDPATPTVVNIYTALSALDEYMIEMGVKNSRAWFKGDMSRDVVSALYTPSVRFSRDADGNLKSFPPSLKIQLRKKDGKFETAVYDEQKRPMEGVPLEDILVKRAHLTVLMQCTGVWFAGGKFGLSWKAIQIRADKIPERIRGFAFLDDGEAGEQAPASSVKAKSQNQFQDLDDDEDGVDDEAALAPPSKPEEVHEEEEEEDVEEVAPAPVPAKAAPKKLVKTAPKVVAKK